MNWMGKGLKGNKIVIETVLMVIFSFFFYLVSQNMCVLAGLCLTSIWLSSNTLNDPKRILSVLLLFV